MGGGDVRLVSVDRAILGIWPCRFRLVDRHVPTGASGYRFGRSRHITGAKPYRILEFTFEFAGNTQRVTKAGSGMTSS